VDKFSPGEFLAGAQDKVRVETESRPASLTLSKSEGEGLQRGARQGRAIALYASRPWRTC
jgi:hypothetical protein